MKNASQQCHTHFEKRFIILVTFMLAARLMYGAWERWRQPPDPAELLSAETETLFWTDDPELAQISENPFKNQDAGRQGYAMVNGHTFWFAEHAESNSSHLRYGGFTWAFDSLAELEKALDPSHNLENRPDVINAQNHLNQPANTFLMTPLPAHFSHTSSTLWLAGGPEHNNEMLVNIFIPRDKSKSHDPTAIRPQPVKDFKPLKNLLQEWPGLQNQNIELDNSVHFQVHFWNFSITVDGGLNRFDDGLRIDGTLRNDFVP